jgi:hypothetical protein
MNPSNQFPAENIVPGSHLESANETNYHEVDLSTLSPELIARAEAPVTTEDWLSLPNLIKKIGESAGANDDRFTLAA